MPRARGRGLKPQRRPISIRLPSSELAKPPSPDLNHAKDTMRRHLAIIIAYLGLLLLALPVPLWHRYRLAEEIEARRPVIRLDDGSHALMLMPSHLLILRGLGKLSQVIPFAVLIAFALSCWVAPLDRPKVLFATALCQCAFTTLYALFSTMVIVMEWQTRSP